MQLSVDCRVYNAIFKKVAHRRLAIQERPLDLQLCPLILLLADQENILTVAQDSEKGRGHFDYSVTDSCLTFSLYSDSFRQL